MSETLNNELRGSGVRITLITPSFTGTKCDVNSAETEEKIASYVGATGLAWEAFLKKAGTESLPESVGGSIVSAAPEPWKMRSTSDC